MPWFTKPLEYTCDDCKTRFYNRAPKPTDRGQAASPVTATGPAGMKTYCATCAPGHMHGMSGSTAALGTSFSVTITYNIHGHGKTSFLSGPALMSAMTNTASAMVACGALGKMQHPGYPGGMVAAPNAYTGPNLGIGALKAWPGDQVGKASHHVHVGTGHDQRVLFGWAATPYPSKLTQVQSLTLYIGS